MTDNPYESPESNLASTNRKPLILTKTSLFKLFFIGYLFGVGPLMLISAVYSFMTGSGEYLTFNGEALSGVTGLVGSFLLIPAFALFYAGVSWCFCAFGLWLYGLFRPVKLEFK